VIKNLALDRPLAIVDLETTGIDPQTPRIIEIGILKLKKRIEAKDTSDRAR
jgi:DNA polymerase III subunit epsilon